MRFLLINTNPAVSKLINASLNRIGHEVTEIGDYNNLSLDTYIAIIIDSDSYKTEYMDDLLAVSLAPSLIYLKAQDKEVPKGFQYVLRKPFLPTDFLSFIVSVLNTASELHRFITLESKQFENIPLPEGASVNYMMSLKEETRNIGKEYQSNSANYSEILDNFKETKNPIFDIQESLGEQTSAYGETGNNVFLNLSEELEKLYEDEETGSAEQKIEPIFKAASNANSIQEKDLQHEETILNPATKTMPQEFNMNNFDVESKDDSQINTKNSFVEKQSKIVEEHFAPTSAKIVTEEKMQQDDLTTDNNNEKINFDFGILDKSQDSTILQEADFISDRQNETITKDSEADAEVKLEFGFKDLAKEFDDLIIGSTEEKTEDRIDDNKKNISEKISELKHPKNEFENLSEKDMQKALQESGMLPPSKDIEVVKTEIGQVVEQSVKGMLQSQILRDVFKGLKMNITITFEDKD
jgi:uncharacterized membrane protein